MKDSHTRENQPQVLQVYPIAPMGEEERIDFLEIWLSLRKHRKIFLRVFLGILGLSFLLILFVPKKYALTTSLEIGTSIQNDHPVSIEAPETVKAKLENAFIPLVINRLTKSGEDAERYRVAVMIPKKSTLIVLESKIRESDEARYKLFHDRIVSSIVSDHRHLLEVIRKRIETALESARIKLAEIQDPATLTALVNRKKKDLEAARSQLAELTDPTIFGTKIKAQENIIRKEENRLYSLQETKKLLNARLMRIGAQQALIRDEIQSLQERIDQSLSLQHQSAQEAGNAYDAMSQLLIDRQVMEDQKWLAKLKEQLHIKLENEKEEIEKALKDNARDQELAQAQIDQAKGVLEELRSTNKLEQKTLRASILDIESSIQKLINDQKRKIQAQQQVVDELLAKLDNFVETRAVVPPTRSPEPISLSRKIQFFIAILLAGLFALLAVVVANFRERIRAYESQVKT